MNERGIIILVGMVLLLSTSLVFIATFRVAYLNPDKAVTIYINNYGEAELEKFIWAFTVVFGIAAFYLVCKDIILSEEKIHG